MKQKKFNDPSRQIPIDPSILYIGEYFVDITDDLVPGVYDYYMVSNCGRVYHKYLGIFMRPGVSGSGYLFVYLSTYYGPRMMQLHRLVLMAFRPIHNPEDFQANHKNGDKHDDIILNLEWNTRSENVKHSYRTGLHKRNSNLSEADVIKVCDLLATGKYINKEIAEMVGNGMTEIIVGDIKKKTSWAYLSKDYTFNQRPGKLFSDSDVENMCQYFASNPIGNLTVNDHCRNALAYCGLNTDDKVVDCARKIYIRKYYTNISCKYNF